MQIATARSVGQNSGTTINACKEIISFLRLDMATQSNEKAKRKLLSGIIIWISFTNVIRGQWQTKTNFFSFLTFLNQHSA